MSALKDRVFYGCQQHAGEWTFGCESCLISAVGRLTDEVERLDREAIQVNTSLLPIATQQRLLKEAGYD